jgi:DNA-directed RNA polymerase alpha subunit
MERRSSNGILLRGTSPKEAASIRRMFCEIPCLAMSGVEIIRNTSIIADDVIEHLISLIPIAYNGDIENIPLFEGELTQNNSVQLEIDIENREDHPISVTAKDIKDEEDMITFPFDCFICYLAKGQKLNVIIYATKGTALNNVIYRTVSTTLICRPQIDPDQTDNPQLGPEDMEKIASVIENPNIDAVLRSKLRRDTSTFYFEFIGVGQLSDDEIFDSVQAMFTERKKDVSILDSLERDDLEV